MRRHLRFIVAAIAVAAVINGVTVAAFLASIAVSADIDLPITVSGYIESGWFDAERANQRLAADGHAYRIEPGHSNGGTAPGAVGLVRDYLLPARFDGALRGAQASLLISGMQLVLLAILALALRAPQYARTTLAPG